MWALNLFGLAAIFRRHIERLFHDHISSTLPVSPCNNLCTHPFFSAYRTPQLRSYIPGISNPKMLQGLWRNGQHKAPQLAVPEMVPETHLSSMNGRNVTWGGAVPRMIAHPSLTGRLPTCKVGKVHVSSPVATRLLILLPGLSPLNAPGYGTGLRELEMSCMSSREA